MVKRVTRRCKKRKSRKSQRGGVFGWGSKTKVVPNPANEAAANKAAANKAAANNAAVQRILQQLQGLFPITIGKYGSIEWDGNEDRTMKTYSDKRVDPTHTPEQTHGLYLLLKVWGLDDMSSGEQPAEFDKTQFKLIKTVTGDGDMIDLTYNGEVMASIAITFQGEIYGH